MSSLGAYYIQLIDNLISFHGRVSKYCEILLKKIYCDVSVRIMFAQFLIC